jgi:hypothetical protein
LSSSKSDCYGASANTLVVVTSDNGPWRNMGAFGGSAGPFRGGKVLDVVTIAGCCCCCCCCCCYC